MVESSYQLAPATSFLANKLGKLHAPLDRSRPGDSEAKALLSAPIQDLFPEARSPKAALAGLLLIAGYWEDAHRIAQDLDNREGSYWHALAHRVEPDTWNSNYWFGRVGTHAIFPTLSKAASAILKQHPQVDLNLEDQWDTQLFNDWCDRARHGGDAELTSAVAAIHAAECWLLWFWCAASKTQ
jgi:hypothetical protein